MGSFMVPVYELMGVTQSLQEMRTSMERIDDVMSYKPDVEFKDEEESAQEEKKEEKADK